MRDVSCGKYSPKAKGPAPGLHPALGPLSPSPQSPVPSPLLRLEGVIRSAIARERHDDDVGAFGDLPDVLRALIAGRHEEPDLLAHCGLMRRERTPDGRGVVPVRRELRRRSALPIETVPVLDAASRIPAPADIDDHPEGVLNRAVPARRCDVGPPAGAVLL